MDSETYWAKRAKEREAAWYKKSQETIEKELARYYLDSLGRIQTDIAALYGRFAKDNELSSITEARKLITGPEYRQWRMSIDRYVRKIKATNDPGLLKELNTLAMRSRISRLDKLYSETLQELDGLGRKASKSMQSFLSDAYKDNYYRGLYDIGKAGQLLPAISQVDQKVLTDVLRDRWSGKNYSQRLWKNQRLMAQTLKTEMVTAMHRGDSVDKIAARVAKRLGVANYQANRLVRTELTYVTNQASLASVKESGMKYYRFIATLDRRTSSVCRSRDGHVYEINDAVAGTNLPPLHPNCRSTIAGTLYGEDVVKTGTRVARDDKGGTVYVPADMRYEDWQAVYVDKTESLEKWKKKHPKSGILRDKSIQGAVEVYHVCVISKELYSVVTPDIRTDEVIITEKQMQHIVERHPDAYDRVIDYLEDAVLDPDYIIKDKHPNTGLVIKKMKIGEEYIQLVLRLCTVEDDPEYKNSIISCWQISDKRLQNYLRNKDILYTRE
ncbi:MAG: minor capsid protein [Megasphaera cerevisiae]|jgi:SPP1 gp7 family putative phage head morphogenesis protein|nr:minor capsid protein [Megasphaera cerevisiae]